MKLSRSSQNCLTRSPIENVWEKLAVHESVCSDAAKLVQYDSRTNLVRQSHQFGVIITPTCHIEDAFSVTQRA